MSLHILLEMLPDMEDFTFIPRDHMHMGMHDHLSRCFAAIDPDIIPVGLMFFLDLCFYTHNKRLDRIGLLGCGFKDLLKMTPGDDQRMPPGDRADVINRISQFVLKDFGEVLAKDTVRHGCPLFIY